jgi:Restriction alleviation protein Lar
MEAMIKKPCPFCFHRGALSSRGEQDMQATIDTWFVRCVSCGSTGPSFSQYHYAEREAQEKEIDAWEVRK